MYMIILSDHFYNIACCYHVVAFTW